MRQITVGFELMVCCFPLRERGNWLWGRRDGTLCLGPTRWRLRRVLANRA